MLASTMCVEEHSRELDVPEVDCGRGCRSDRHAGRGVESSDGHVSGPAHAGVERGPDDREDPSLV